MVGIATDRPVSSSRKFFTVLATICCEERNFFVNFDCLGDWIDLEKFREFLKIIDKMAAVDLSSSNF